MVVRLYPKAILYKNILDPGQGRLKPKGITVHYTAGGSASSSMDHLRETNLRYHLVIDRDGDVYQMVSLNERVLHAGRADWLGYSPNEAHIAVAIASWGKLQKSEGIYRSWADVVIPPSHVNHRSIPSKGEYWEKSSTEQETALLNVLVWLAENCMISPDHICGHEEAAPKRKLDPGGSLSYTMSEIRNIVGNFLEASAPS